MAQAAAGLGSMDRPVRAPLRDWAFPLAVLAMWAISVSPLDGLAKALLAPGPSAGIGIMVGLALLYIGSAYHWLQVIALVVLAEQIFVVGSSFIDEAAIALMLVYFLTKSFPARHTFSAILVLVFLAVASISALVNNVPMKVLVAADRSYLQYAVVFLALWQLRLSEEQKTQTLANLVRVGAIFAVIGLFNLAVGQTSLTGRAEGVLSNPNALAGYLVFVAPIVWFEMRPGGHVYLVSPRVQRILGFVIIVAVLASGGRAISVGLWVGLILVTMVRPGHVTEKLRLALLLAGLLLVSIILTDGQVLERFGLLLSSAYLDVETNVRTYYTQQGWRLFAENPFLGVGPGRFGGSVATIYPSPVYAEYGIRTPRDWAGIIQADIFYPHLLAEVGFIASAAFMALVTMPVFRWLRLVMTRSVAWTSRGAALTASLICILIAAIGGPYFELHLTAYFFWLYARLVYDDLVRHEPATDTGTRGG